MGSGKRLRVIGAVYPGGTEARFLLAMTLAQTRDREEPGRISATSRGETHAKQGKLAGRGRDGLLVAQPGLFRQKLREFLAKMK